MLADLVEILGQELTVMKCFVVLSVTLYFIVSAVQSSFSQTATGISVFNTINREGNEAVNLANLNVHWDIPIFSRSTPLPPHFFLNHDNSPYFKNTSRVPPFWDIPTV